MTNRYILRGKTPVPEPDLAKWAQAFELPRTVAKDHIGDAEVSTVFLGLDHSIDGGPPLLFETMIFGGTHDEYQERYSTWEDAERGHAAAVGKVRGSLKE